MAAGLGGLLSTFEGIKQVGDVSKLGKVRYRFGTPAILLSLCERCGFRGTGSGSQAFGRNDPHRGCEGLCLRLS